MASSLGSALRGSAPSWIRRGMGSWIPRVAASMSALKSSSLEWAAAGSVVLLFFMASWSSGVGLEEIVLLFYESGCAQIKRRSGEPLGGDAGVVVWKKAKGLNV